MKLSPNFKWNKPTETIAFETTGGNKARLFMANEAKRLMNPYVPFDNGVLSQNVKVYMEGKTGVVHYQSRYARYQYAGKMSVDPNNNKGAYYSPEIGFWSRKNVHKVPTGKALNYSTARHPLATSKWDVAMITAHKDDLINAVERYIRSKQ